MIPGGTHHDKWHSDDNESRLVGMSVNLSARLFRGGLFLLRDRQSGLTLAEVANTRLGDAVILRISRDLEHRISDLEGDEPKTAFAGWFDTAGPEWFEELQANSRAADGADQAAVTRGYVLNVNSYRLFEMSLRISHEF